ncbi:hypothetical protein FOT98_11970 [Bacillus sp. HY001]|nr:hypothetical protein FOT98_11970 [Bacillus sp. HY001]
MTFNLLELNVNGYVKYVSHKTRILCGRIVSKLLLWKLKYLIAILMKEIKCEINIFQHTTHLQQLEIMNE